MNLNEEGIHCIDMWNLLEILKLVEKMVSKALLQRTISVHEPYDEFFTHINWII